MFGSVLAEFGYQAAFIGWKLRDAGGENALQCLGLSRICRCVVVMPVGPPDCGGGVVGDGTDRGVTHADTLQWLGRSSVVSLVVRVAWTSSAGPLAPVVGLCHARCGCPWHSIM